MNPGDKRDKNRRTGEWWETEREGGHTKQVKMSLPSNTQNSSCPSLTPPLTFVMAYFFRTVSLQGTPPPVYYIPFAHRQLWQRKPFLPNILRRWEWLSALPQQSSGTSLRASLSDVRPCPAGSVTQGRGHGLNTRNQPYAAVLIQTLRQHWHPLNILIMVYIRNAAKLNI